MFSLLTLLTSNVVLRRKNKGVGFTLPLIFLIANFLRFAMAVLAKFPSNHYLWLSIQFIVWVCVAQSGECIMN